VRLALVTHNVLPGSGQGRVNYEIARHALREGIDVYLVADRVHSELRELGARWIEVHPRRQRLNLLKVREFARRASEAVASLASEVDVVHGNGFVLNCRHEINTSHFVHSAWRRSPARSPRVPRNARQAYHSLYTTLNARWEHEAYEKAEIVVAVSNLVRDEVARIGIPEERIRVVLNGVDLHEFSPGSRDRTRHGLPAGVPLAVFVGEAHTRRKNLETVLAALRHARALHVAVVGSVAGSGYPRLAARLGVAARVHFLGFRADVADVMRCADVFVLPARYDPCPLVLLEALASGVPVVTAVTVGGAELVTPESGLVLPDPNDARALAAALERVADASAEAGAMRQAARRVAESHSWEHMAEEYVALYREVAV
jgi:glycosyltransferase involved in cell wall biosynthesis